MSHIIKEKEKNSVGVHFTINVCFEFLLYSLRLLLLESLEKLVDIANCSERVITKTESLEKHINFSIIFFTF